MITYGFYVRLKQGKQVAKQRRKENLAPTPAGAEEYWRTHALPTDRIKPPAKTLEAIEEDLKKWFKEKWVRFGPDGKIRGDCARGSSKEGKPKCLPQSKAHALGKSGRASAAAKKRREDPDPERRGAAKNVATKVKEANVKRPQPYHDKDWHKKLSPEDLRKLTGPDYKKINQQRKEKKELDEKQDACYRKVKSRYKVWPSAYASGALVQCRKKGAANWGTGAKKK